ncbi:hypothetical protein [Rubritalea tangerina]
MDFEPGLMFLTLFARVSITANRLSALLLRSIKSRQLYLLRSLEDCY